MNWKFWKADPTPAPVCDSTSTSGIPAGEEKPVTVPKPKARVLYIPDDKIREILLLADADTRAEEGDGANAVAQFDLWTAIYEIFPETQRGHWVLNLTSATQPRLIERL